MHTGVCHLCWGEAHGYSEREVRRPGPINARCTEHMRTQPIHFVCQQCGHEITNTAGQAESMDEAVSLLGELMAYLMSDAGEEDRADLMREDDDPDDDLTIGSGPLCHSCWHHAQPGGGRGEHTRDQPVCPYHGYQEMLPEGLYRCAGCERGMIILHTQAVAWIREKFELPVDMSISRENPEHRQIRDFMYEYAEMQEITRRN